MRSFNLRPQGVPPAWAAVCLVALLALPACARSPAHGALRPLGVTPTSARASLPPPPQGELAFETAVRQLVARHPELIALRAEAAAIDPDPARVRIDAEARVRDGEVGALKDDISSLHSAVIEAIEPRMAAIETRLEPPK